MSNSPNGSMELLPIDLALLDILPDEGQTIGFQPIAISVRSIGERPEFKGINPEQISGRLRAMKKHGYTASAAILPVHRGAGWQRTSKGRKAASKGAVTA